MRGQDFISGFIVGWLLVRLIQFVYRRIRRVIKGTA